MKRFITVSMLTFAFFLFQIQITFAQPDTLTIIHVNDSHSNLLPHPMVNGEYGGLARAASVIGLILLIEAGTMILYGLWLSLGELAKNVVKRLKESRERNKAKRDRQRQARRNKPGSASQ